MKVTAIATDSATGITTIEAEVSNEEGWVASCSQTKERMVVENGKLQYDKNCIAGKTLQTTTIKMNTTVLPPVGVQKGDEINFWASVQSIDANTISSSKTKAVKKQHHSANSALITTVERGGKVVFNIDDIYPRT